MKIIWNSTGDFLNLDPTHQELAEYWINALNHDNKNNFHLSSTKFNPAWLSDLRQHLTIINQHLTTKLKNNSFECFINADLLDQQTLNQLHRTWVGVLENYPMVPALLKKIDPDSALHWDQINKKLHYIEKEIICSYHSFANFWEVDNIFGPQILNFNRAHIRLKFSQKGRSTFNKWLNQDFNINDTDTNNYFQIGAEVNINLNREIIQLPPTNYVDFCQETNIEVVGANLNLANFNNYELKLTEIRHILIRNILHENNTALFEF
jgi:hypothetical protein